VWLKAGGAGLQARITTGPINGNVTNEAGAAPAGAFGLGRLHGADLGRLQPLRTLLKLELDRLTLFEGAESVHLDGGVMYEDIRPSIRL
jgi:hypothetical protein